MTDKASGFGQFGKMVEDVKQALRDETLFTQYKDHFSMLSSYTHGGTSQIIGAVNDQGEMTEVHADEDCVYALLEAVYMVVFVCLRIGMAHGRLRESRALALGFNQFETLCEPSEG